jgi:hypothetical protein
MRRRRQKKKKKEAKDKKNKAKMGKRALAEGDDGTEQPPRKKVGMFDELRGDDPQV